MAQLRSHHIETALNAIGYSHGRHEDQAQRVRDFGKVVKGANFMTPRRAGLYRLKSNPYRIVEVSLGDDFLGNPMIGVTVADSAQQEHLYDLNSCVNSVEELQDKFRALEAA